MKANKVVRIIEKKTVKECVEKYILQNNKGDFLNRDEMYEKMKANIKGLQGLAFCLGVDVFEYRLKAENDENKVRKDVVGMYISEKTLLSPYPDINDDVDEVKYLTDNLDILNSAYDTDEKKEQLNIRLVGKCFDKDGKLYKDFQSTVVNSEYSIDDNILFEHINKIINISMKTNNASSDKIRWEVELIEGSLIHYEFPYVTISKKFVENGRSEMYGIKLYNLTENLKDYKKPEITFYGDRSKEQEVVKSFKKKIIIASILGAAQFILFFMMFASWIFIPLFAAALGGAIYFLIKALPDGPKGKNRLKVIEETNKIIKENVDSCLNELAEEAIEKIVFIDTSIKRS